MYELYLWGAYWKYFHYMQSDRQHIHITSLIRYENTGKLSTVNLKRRFVKISQSCLKTVSDMKLGRRQKDRNLTDGDGRL